MFKYFVCYASIASHFPFSFERCAPDKLLRKSFQNTPFSSLRFQYKNGSVSLTYAHKKHSRTLAFYQKFMCMQSRKTIDVKALHCNAPKAKAKVDLNQ